MVEGSMSDAGTRFGGSLPAAAVDEYTLTRASLDLVPAAVAVVNRERLLVKWNQRFETRFGVTPAATCCEILGCGDPQGPTGGRCVTEAVLLGDGPWRGEVQPEAGPAQLLVVSQAGAFVTLRFEASPGVDAQERAPLQMFTLGSLRIAAEDDAPEWLEQRPGLLLKYLLAMRHRPVRPDEVIESLWPESLTAGPGTVRYIVHQLRRRLEPELPPGADSSFILRTTRGYQLDLSMVWVDADAFESVVRTAVAAAVRGDTREADRAAGRAADLYRGDFLRDDPYEEWAHSERNRLHGMLETPLRMLVDARMAAGDLEGAAAYAERLARHEPLDADVQRVVLELWLRQGRRGKALRHYDMFCARVRRAFGQPAPFTLAELSGWD